MDKSHTGNVSFHSVDDSDELQGLISTANKPRNRDTGLLQP